MRHPVAWHRWPCWVHILITLPAVALGLLVSLLPIRYAVYVLGYLMLACIWMASVVLCDDPRTKDGEEGSSAKDEG